MTQSFLTLSPTDLEKYSPSKIIKKDGATISYKSGAEFWFYDNSYTLENFHEVINKTLESKTEFMILGRLNEFGLSQQGHCQLEEDRINKSMARRKKEKDDGIPATVEFTNDSDLMILDLDDHIIKDWNPNKPEVKLKQWCLDRGIKCDVTWQITSSQKLNTDNIRVRLYFLLDKEYSLDHRKAYGISEEINADGSIYSSMQPIFSTSATMEDGIEDFIPKRHGFLKGKTKTHRLPTWEEQEVKERATRHATKYSDYDFDSGILPPEVISGEIYRQFFMPYAFRLANKKLSRVEIIEFIETKSAQIATRIFDLENVESYVDDAISRLSFEKKQKESASQTESEENILKLSIKKDKKFTNHEWPSGLLGRLAKEIFPKMPWSQSELAILSARVCLGGFIGRKFSLHGLNLNQNNVLLGPQAIGKETMNWVQNSVLDQLQDLPQAKKESFAHPFIGRFRSAKAAKGVTAMHRAMCKSPSTMILISEAGAASKSISGDMPAVGAYTLQNFAIGAHNVFTVDDFTQQLPDIYGTNFVRIEEAELNSYVHNFTTDVATSGEFARKNHFFIDHKPHSMQSDFIREFSDELIADIWRVLDFAMKGEDFDFVEKVGNNEWRGPSLIKLPKEDRVELKLNPEAQEIFEKHRQDEFEKRKETKDPYDQKWAEMARYREKVLREAAFYSALDWISKGCPKDEEMAPLAFVTKTHYEEAAAFIDECDRGTRANSSLFNSLNENLVEEIYRFGCDSFEKKSYLKNHTTPEAEHMVIKHAFITRGNGRIAGIAKRAAAEGFKSAEVLLNDSYEEGEALGYWKILDKKTQGEFYSDFAGLHYSRARRLMFNFKG